MMMVMMMIMDWCGCWFCCCCCYCVDCIRLRCRHSKSTISIDLCFCVLFLAPFPSNYYILFFFPLFQADFNSFLLLNVFDLLRFFRQLKCLMSMMTNRIALQPTHTSKSITLEEIHCLSHCLCKHIYAQTQTKRHRVVWLNWYFVWVVC